MANSSPGIEAPNGILECFLKRIYYSKSAANLAAEKFKKAGKNMVAYECSCKKFHLKRAEPTEEDSTGQ